jgi:hypothetical protein
MACLQQLDQPATPDHVAARTHAPRVAEKVTAAANNKVNT